MRQDILEVLQKDGRLTAAEIAIMLGLDEEEVQQEIDRLEKKRIILGYHALVNWEKTVREIVTAQINVKVTPQRGYGFDQTAQRIAEFPQVQAVYLFSGNFDLMVIVEGKTMKDIATFVSNKLAVMDDVISCTTHFVLKKYKQNGFLYEDSNDDERPRILL